MSNSKRFVIEAKTGKAFSVSLGQKLKITDIEGMQVADLTAVNATNHNEVLSMGATIDNNNSVRIREGDNLYSNLYNVMFSVYEDVVGKHDLLHPMCSPDMFLKQYEKSGHPSCEENIKTAFREHGVSLSQLPIPLNVFMNKSIDSDGTITVEEPKSKPGSYLILEASMNLIVAISACSVEESRCNGFKCTPVDVHLFK